MTWGPILATSHTSLELMSYLKFSTFLQKCIFRNMSVFRTYLWRDVEGEITITVFAQVRGAKKGQQLKQSQIDCAWLFRIYIEVCHMAIEASETALVTQPTRVRISCPSSWLQCPTGSEELKQLLLPTESPRSLVIDQPLNCSCCCPYDTRLTLSKPTGVFVVASIEQWANWKAIQLSKDLNP